MLVFGPYRSIPKDVPFTVFNLSSPNESIPRLPGLFINPNLDMFSIPQEESDICEKRFDAWYYEYVTNDVTACSSLMAVLNSLLAGQNVYVCISEYQSDITASIINESFMKLIQTRYDIKYSIINDPEDFDYIPRDGCDFMGIEGLMNFDRDCNTFMRLVEEQRLMNGGPIDEEW